MSDTGLNSRVDAAFATYLGDCSYRDSPVQCAAVRFANDEWQQTHMVESQGTPEHFRALERAMLIARREEASQPTKQAAPDRINAPKVGLQFAGGRQTMLDPSEVEYRKGEYIPSRREPAKQLPRGVGGVFQGFQTGDVKDGSRPFGRNSRILDAPERDLHTGNIPSRTRPLGRLETHVVDQNSRYRPSPEELMAEDAITEGAEVELTAPPSREEQIRQQRAEIADLQSLHGRSQRGYRSVEHPDGSVTIFDLN
jgi:hypothetical protein